MATANFAMAPNTVDHTGIKVYVDDHRIAHVTLSSPPVNALTPTLLQSLQTAVKSLPELGAKGFILNSEFKKVFSAGLDLNLLIRKDEETYEAFYERTKLYLYELHEAARVLLLSELPSVACLEGAAPAGGTVLGLCCDYRIAPADTEGIGFLMGLNETMVGMSPPTFVQELAKMALSPRMADRAVQHGMLFPSPQAALEVGYVDELVPTCQDMVPRAIQEIQAALKVPWKARAHAKTLARRLVIESLNLASAEFVSKSISGDEFQNVAKGIVASLKKRK